MAKDWKEQYFEALEQQQQQQQRYGRKTSLLVQALLATSRMAAGIDDKTDRSLAGLRGLLKKESLPNADLDLAVSAVESQLRTALDARQQASTEIIEGLQTMAGELRQAGKDPVTVRQAQLVQQQLKNLDFYYTGLPAMLKTLGDLQAYVLADNVAARQPAPVSQASTPAAVPLWSRLFGAAGVPEGAAKVAATSAPTTAPADTADQQPDWKLEPTVRHTLEKLLLRVTPPASVISHYKAAKALISHDLNGFELAPALEHLCEVLLASIQRDQDEFEAFLNQLNIRLQEAYNQLALGLQLSQEETSATSLFSQTMLAQVSAFQTSVASAGDLDTLKTSVRSNLEQIVITIDERTRDGLRRQASLGKELESMTERLKAMEQSSQLAAAQLEEQKQLAMHDALTRLPNRAAYNQRAAEELARWQRHKGPLSLAVCDVDWFKKVNDHYGHAAGDRVLQVLASTLRSRLRKSDFVARFGGEEFVMLLPETDVEQAIGVLDSLRLAVEAGAIGFEGENIKITISIGLTIFQGKDNLESAFARADRALYDAKAAGRNCCRVIRGAAEPSAAM
jgi:diguanylate cyclase